MVMSVIKTGMDKISATSLTITLQNVHYIKSTPRIITREERILLAVSLYCIRLANVIYQWVSNPLIDMHLFENSIIVK